MGYRFGLCKNVSGYCYQYKYCLQDTRDISKYHFIMYSNKISMDINIIVDH